MIQELPTMERPRVRTRRLPNARVCAVAVAVAASALSLRPLRAEPSLNVGVEAGAAKRVTSTDPQLKLGFAFGTHIDVGPLPMILFGVYFLQSFNDPGGSAQVNDALFTALGLHTRLVLPLKGDFKPYATIGFGSTWARYRATNIVVANGQFWETPVGLGVGYRVLELFQISAEGAYRPSSRFTGDAYESLHMPEPKSGWSALFGVGLDI